MDYKERGLGSQSRLSALSVLTNSVDRRAHERSSPEITTESRHRSLVRMSECAVRSGVAPSPRQSAQRTEHRGALSLATASGPLPLGAGSLEP
eukprot:64501-Prymnesium_polylepis.2